MGTLLQSSAHNNLKMHISSYLNNVFQNNSTNSHDLDILKQQNIHSGEVKTDMDFCMWYNPFSVELIYVLN